MVKTINFPFGPNGKLNLIFGTLIFHLFQKEINGFNVQRTGKLMVFGVHRNGK